MQIRLKYTIKIFQLQLKKEIEKREIRKQRQAMAKLKQNAE